MAGGMGMLTIIRGWAAHKATRIAARASRHSRLLSGCRRWYRYLFCWDARFGGRGIASSPCRQLYIRRQLLPAANNPLGAAVGLCCCSSAARQVCTRCCSMPVVGTPLPHGLYALRLPGIDQDRPRARLWVTQQGCYCHVGSNAAHATPFPGTK